MKKAMKNLYKYFAYFCGGIVIFCYLYELFISLAYYELWNPIFTKWQVPIVLQFYFLLLGITIFSIYKKYYFVLFILLISSLTIARSGIIWKNLSDFKIIREMDICYDTNYCKDFSFSWINEKSCLEKGYAWNIEDKGCQTFFQEEDCFRLEGNWIYPEVCEKKVEDMERL